MIKNILYCCCIGLIGIACNQANEKAGKEQNQPVLSANTTVASGETPYLFTDTKGQVYLSWTQTGDSINHLLYAQLEDDMTWSQPRKIASGTDWFVNWADYPMIVTKTGQNFMAHYLAKSSSGTYSYDINMRHSADKGQNWSNPHVLHDDGKNAEHGFVSMVPYGDNFFVTWLDGRNTVGPEGQEGHGGAMSIRAAVITPSGEKLEEWELDDRTCDCCQTTAAITSNGPVVIYRDRTEDEVRDMSIVRYVDGKWTAPESLHDDNWKIAGCPVNGPRASAIDNHMAVAWFSAADGKPLVKVKFSADGGASFGEVITIDQGKAIGRVDVAMIKKDQAIISWMEGNDIVAAIVNDDGEVLNRLTIASSSQSRGSGFPQLTKKGDTIIFAWTDTEEKAIKTASLVL